MRDAKNWKIPYKGFMIVQDGTNVYPWNIYIDKGDGTRGEHVGYDRTIKRCKFLIDDGCFDEELNDFVERKERKKNKNQRQEINEDFDTPDYINYKGVNIEKFSYHASYGDEEWDNTSYIIMSPYYLQSRSDKPKAYLPLYAEDYDGDVVEFPTLRDAKDYIDEYIIPKAGHIKIKHGDEVHYVLD